MCRRTNFLKMFKIFIIIAVAILERTDQFEFSITKDLKTSRELETEKWTHVEVIENENITINVRVPLSFSYSDLSVFFANDVKEILEVHLTETLRGKFYAMPYKAEKEMRGQNVTVFQTHKFQEISAIFPASWLPKRSTKISAAITDVDGHLCNYYGLKNFEISIPDLLLLEEYKRYPRADEKLMRKKI